MAARSKAKKRAEAEAVVGLWFCDTGEAVVWLVTRDVLDAAGQAERSELVKRYSDKTESRAEAVALATRLGRRVILTDEEGERTCVFTPPPAAEDSEPADTETQQLGAAS